MTNLIKKRLLFLYGPHFIKRKQFKRLKNFMSRYKTDTAFVL